MWSYLYSLTCLHSWEASYLTVPSRYGALWQRIVSTRRLEGSCHTYFIFFDSFSSVILFFVCFLDFVFFFSFPVFFISLRLVHILQNISLNYNSLPSNRIISQIHTLRELCNFIFYFAIICTYFCSGLVCSYVL